jgi:CheY-like chemotaxis protein
MQVKVVGELLADALVLPARPVSIGLTLRGRGEKILVIDDEPDIVTYLTTLLEDHGYAVGSAFSADEGMQRIHEERPALITLDIIMPGKSGTKMYHDLRSDGHLKEIPVVMITGVNEAQNDFRKYIYERSLPHPEGFLEKPVNQEHLLITVDKILHTEA